jgi:hypothetical protein
MKREESNTSVNLAEIYRELADAMQGESPEFKKVMKKVKEAAARGEYSIRIDVDDDVLEWVRTYHFSRRNLVPSLIKRLDESGFRYGNEKRVLSFWGRCQNSIMISWASSG